MTPSLKMTPIPPGPGYGSDGCPLRLCKPEPVSVTCAEKDPGINSHERTEAGGYKVTCRKMSFADLELGLDYRNDWKRGRRRLRRRGEMGD